jgi:cytidylate kinase
MGTVVFPNADVKFFLDASLTTRALRRYEELKSNSGQYLNVSLDEVKQQMQKRDENDQSRAIAPLRPAEDAIKIDATNLTAGQVVDVMMQHINRHLKI